MTESPYGLPESITPWLIGYTPIENKKFNKKKEEKKEEKTIKISWLCEHAILFLNWEEYFCSCSLERFPLADCFQSGWSTKFWRSEKPWHILAKLISSFLHREFRGAWCRQSSKWWSWCSTAEHLGFPTGIIGMKWVMSHHIYRRVRREKVSVKLNTVLQFTLITHRRGGSFGGSMELAH